jgi:hypothetical protein
MLANAAPGWLAAAENLEAEADRLDGARDDPKNRGLGSLLDQHVATCAAEAERLRERALELKARVQVADTTGMLLVSRRSTRTMHTDEDRPLAGIFATAAGLGRVRYLEDVESSAGR